MPERPKRHGRPRIEARVAWSLPQLRVRRIPTGAQPPAPGSRMGGTGTPKHSIRCPDELWGAAIQRLHGRGLQLSPVMRGYLAAIARGEAELYPDPLGEPSTDEDAEP